MGSGLIITLEIFGVLGVVLLLGGRELWLLRRDKRNEERRRQETSAHDEMSGR